MDKQEEKNTQQLFFSAILTRKPGKSLLRIRPLEKRAN